MHLDGVLVDSVDVCAALLQTQRTRYLNEVKAGLISKHTDLLATTAAQPAFILCGVPSCINFFTPLKHPTH